eukprot:4087734-Amphidinium_carterae.1
MNFNFWVNDVTHLFKIDLNSKLDVRIVGTVAYSTIKVRMLRTRVALGDEQLQQRGVRSASQQASFRTGATQYVSGPCDVVMRQESRHTLASQFLLSLELSKTSILGSGDNLTDPKHQEVYSRERVHRGWAACHPAK